MKHIKLIIFLVILLVLNLSSLSDRLASNYIDDALATSATVYVAARGLNATISVIQDIEISAGIASVSPGEFLDPLNDLIERFSTVILFATASLGIQKIMLTISGWIVLQLIIVTVIMLLIVYLYFRCKFSFISTGNIGIVYKVLIFLLVLRFSVPFMAIANGVVEAIFLKDDVNEHIQQLQQVEKSTKKLSRYKNNHDNHSTNRKEQSDTYQTSKTGIIDDLINKTNTMIDSLTEKADELNPNKQARLMIEQIKNQSAKAISSITRLMSLFVAQSILLPILFLYFVLFSARVLYRYDFRIKHKQLSVLYNSE